jgi:hypothetical protein
MRRWRRPGGGHAASGSPGDTVSWCVHTSATAALADDTGPGAHDLRVDTVVGSGVRGVRTGGPGGGVRVAVVTVTVRGALRQAGGVHRGVRVREVARAEGGQESALLLRLLRAVNNLVGLGAVGDTCGRVAAGIQAHTAHRVRHAVGVGLDHRAVAGEAVAGVGRLRAGLLLVLVAHLAAVVDSVHGGVLQLRAGSVGRGETVFLGAVHEVHEAIALRPVKCLL